jgi:hypothetical protein
MFTAELLERYAELMRKHDRIERLDGLAGRLDRSALILRRRLCDLPTGTGERGRMVRRISLVEDRRDRLRRLARVLRHEARLSRNA